MASQYKPVCLLEPDEAVRSAITALLQQRGWEVISDSTASDLKVLLEEEQPAAIISESDLPDLTAQQVLEIAKDKKIPVIFLGHGREIQAAVDLMRLGAEDFLQKTISATKINQNT